MNPSSDSGEGGRDLTRVDEHEAKDLKSRVCGFVSGGRLEPFKLVKCTLLL